MPRGKRWAFGRALKNAKRASLALLITAASLGIGVAGAIALSGGNSSSDSPASPVYTAIPDRDSPPPRPTGARMLAAMPDAVSSAYGVFRRASEPKDQLSPELAGKLERHAVNPSFVRLLTPSAVSARRFYAAPLANGMLCLVDGTGAAACSQLADAEQWGITGITECGPGAEPGRVLLYGLVPDGASVELVFPDGRASDVPVENNAWSYLAPRSSEKRPAYLVLTKGSASRRLPFGYSPNIDENCPAPVG